MCYYTVKIEKFAWYLKKDLVDAEIGVKMVWENLMIPQLNTEVLIKFLRIFLEARETYSRANTHET